VPLIYLPTLQDASPVLVIGTLIGWPHRPVLQGPVGELRVQGAAFDWDPGPAPLSAELWGLLHLAGTEADPAGYPRSPSPVLSLHNLRRLGDRDRQPSPAPRPVAGERLQVRALTVDPYTVAVTEDRQQWPLLWTERVSGRVPGLYTFSGQFTPVGTRLVFEVFTAQLHPLTSQELS